MSHRFAQMRGARTWVSIGAASVAHSPFSRLIPRRRASPFRPRSRLCLRGLRRKAASRRRKPPRAVMANATATHSVPLPVYQGDAQSHRADSRLPGAGKLKEQIVAELPDLTAEDIASALNCARPGRLCAHRPGLSHQERSLRTRF